MEFVNEINEKEEKKHKAKKAPTTLQIGFIKYKNGDIEFELKDVKVTDVELTQLEQTESTAQVPPPDTLAPKAK